MFISPKLFFCVSNGFSKEFSTFEKKRAQTKKKIGRISVPSNHATFHNWQRWLSKFLLNYWWLWRRTGVWEMDKWHSDWQCRTRNSCSRRPGPAIWTKSSASSCSSAPIPTSGPRNTTWRRFTWPAFTVTRTWPRSWSSKAPNWTPWTPGNVLLSTTPPVPVTRTSRRSCAAPEPGWTSVAWTRYAFALSLCKAAF